MAYPYALTPAADEIEEKLDMCRRFSPLGARDGVRLGGLDDARPKSEITLDAREGFSGSPRIGAEVDIGDPGGMATSFRDLDLLFVDVERERLDVLADGAGVLYMNVAARTIVDPAINARVIGYEKSATEARNEIMILSEVANPFMILSEYRMTTAVINPPNVCVKTVPTAHALKLLNAAINRPIGPIASPVEPHRIGQRAGMSEKSDN